MNTMTVDPMIAKDDPPATISKIGFDCTIPWGEKWVQSDFQRSAPFELGDPPAAVSPMTEDEIAKEMESLIRSAPRSWKELLQHFRGQNYRDVYRAFGRLRPKLGPRGAAAVSFPTRSAIRATSSAKRHRATNKHRSPASRHLKFASKFTLAMICKEQVHHGTLPCGTRWRSGRALKRHGSRSDKSRRREKGPRT